MTDDNPGAMSGKSSPLRKVRFCVRTFVGAGAALLFAFALMSYFDPAELARYEYWWLMIVAMGVMVVGSSAATDWQRAGLVAATFLLGFGVQLALKQPLWFQYIHIRPTSDFSYLMLAALVLQGATATLILLQNKIFKTGVRVLSEFGWKRILLIMLILFSGSIGAMGYVGHYNYGALFEQFFVASIFLIFNILSFVALVVAAPGNKLRKMSDFVAQAVSLPGSGAQIGKFDKWFPFWLSGGVFVICVFIWFVIFEGIPRIDEVLYLFQAEYFAQGKLTLPLPPSTEAFGVSMMNTHDGKWFAAWPPGWPLVLAIGAFLNMPWIINPLLAAVSILLLHSFVTSMADRRTANLTIFLMFISPWYLYMSSTLMSHTLTYALILGAWVLLIRTRQQSALLMPFAAGALMGLLFLTRPLEGVLMGGLTGLWTFSFLKARGQWKTVFLYGIGCFAIGSVVFPYNAYLTGDPLLTPINYYFNRVWGEGANRIGFGPDIGPPDWGSVDPFEGHSPFEALVQIQQMFYALNFELFGWGVGSTAFVLVFLLWGKWSKLTSAMLVIVVLTIGAHSLYWFAASFYVGPRYWFLTLVPMMILSVAGIMVCIEKFDRIFPQGLVPLRVGGGIAFLCLCSALVFMSWLAFNKYPGFRGYHDEFRMIAKQERFQNSLVFVTTDSLEDYANAFWLNDFSEASHRPLFARDVDMETNRRVASAYPDRRIFFVNGRSKSRRHVGIARGPLSLDDLN